MIETTRRFAADERLIGTFCQPAPATVRTDLPAVLLPNAGIVHRIGPHRLAVRIARRLAMAGITSLRFDLSGVGDSHYSRESLGFQAQSVVDAQQAMNELAAQHGHARFALFGICSGADLGFRAALADPRLTDLFLLDPWAYPNARTHRARARIRLSSEGIARAAGTWLHARLRKRIATTASGAGASSAAEPVSWQNGRPLPDKDWFEAGLRALDTRGARIQLVYSGSFLHSYSYAAQFAESHGHLGLSDRIHAAFQPALDHTVTRLAAQQTLFGMIDDWIAQAGSGQIG